LPFAPKLPCPFGAAAGIPKSHAKLSNLRMNFFFFHLFFDLFFLISSLFVICFVFKIININMHESSNSWYSYDLLDIIYNSSVAAHPFIVKHYLMTCINGG
jgi:hypothetical protein